MVTAIFLMTGTTFLPSLGIFGMVWILPGIKDHAMIRKTLTPVILSCCMASCIAVSQDTRTVINDIDKQLKRGLTTISKVLSSDSLMYLHSLTPFREVIRANAKAGKLSLVTDNEPGIRITVKGLIVDKKGMPQKDITVYVYHTSDKGWYSDTGVHILMNSGDVNHARLFGYLKTDEVGKFEFTSIKAKGYPKSDLAAHIHIHFWSANASFLHGPGELQFDDDPRMTPERRQRSLADGYLIVKNSGTEKKPVYEYRIVVE